MVLSVGTLPSYYQLHVSALRITIYISPAAVCHSVPVPGSPLHCFLAGPEPRKIYSHKSCSRFALANHHHIFLHSPPTHFFSSLLPAHSPTLHSALPFFCPRARETLFLKRSVTRALSFGCLRTFLPALLERSGPPARRLGAIASRQTKICCVLASPVTFARLFLFQQSLRSVLASRQFARFETSIPARALPIDLETIQQAL